MIYRAAFAAVVALGFMVAAYFEPIKAPRQDRRTHAWVTSEARECFPQSPLGSLYSFVKGRARTVIHAFIWGEITETQFAILGHQVGLGDDVIYCLIMNKRRSA